MKRESEVKQETTNEECEVFKKTRKHRLLTNEMLTPAMRKKALWVPFGMMDVSPWYL